MTSLITTSCYRLVPLPLSSSAPLFLAPIRLASPRIFRAQTFQPRSQCNNLHFASYRRQLVHANYRPSAAKKRVNMAAAPATFNSDLSPFTFPPFLCTRLTRLRSSFGLY